MLPDHQFTGRFGTCHVHDEAGEQPLQVEAAIETVGERGEVSGGVLAEGKRVVGTLQA